MALATADILEATQRRLHQLQLSAAQLGYETPPHVANEIKDLEQKLAAATPATVAESHDVLFTLLQETRADVRRLYWLIPVLLLIVVVAVKL